MPLPESGPISMSQVATELGYDLTDISLHDMGETIGIESGNPVSMSAFYGIAGSIPTVQTNTPTSVGSTGMVLNGNITDQGASSITERGFYFGTNANYASNTKYITAGTSTGAYTNTRTGLTAGTTYYATAYATNTQGEARGSTVSQATTGGSITSGSLMRYGTTSYADTANRLIQRSTEEPTTSIRLNKTSTFTVSFWIKAGFTSNLSSQGRHQFMWGVSPSPIGSPNPNNYTSNLYNFNWRCWYDEQLNRIWFSFLGKTSSGVNTYTQNFWWLHKTGTGNAAVQTGLGTTYWSNTNRGNVNENDFNMLTFTYNGSMTSTNLKCYWNDKNIGTPYYGSGQNSGTPINNTSQARLTTLLGTSYGYNGQINGSGDEYAGYGGGNGNTYIDEYSLWDSALSATAVADLYNEGLGGSISTEEQPEGLIVYYSMNSNYQNSSPKYITPVWPSGTSGKMEISGSSDFGSGTNTVSG